MRRWSQELIEDREFEIGGELFEWVYPHWEVGAKLFDGEFDATGETDENGRPKFSWYADARNAVEGVQMFLNPKNDAVKRWKALCARKGPDAIPRHQIVQLYTWLVQVTGGLPTTAPSSEPSVNGAGETEDVSADESLSTEATSTA